MKIESRQSGWTVSKGNHNISVSSYKNMKAFKASVGN